MSKIVYSQNAADLANEFTGDVALEIHQHGHLAKWIDSESGAQIVLKGKDFAASDEDSDRFAGGEIHKIIVTDGDHEKIVTVGSIKIQATELQEVWDMGGVSAVSLYLSNGNDSVLGSATGDYLLGGAGNDKMTGKGGSDYFEFQYPGLSMAESKLQPEHDVITDFDLKGEDADRLGIHQEFTDKGVHQGHDTMLTFEDGSTLLLEHVKKAAFEHYLDTLPSL